MKNALKRNFLLVVAVLGLLASAAGAKCPLKSGDRVVFLGDSITEQRIHTRYVMNYFTLRYPGLDVTFRNAGWSGDTAPGGLGRLQRDVLALKPTVVTICFGMNDGGYSAFDQNRCDWFMKGMTGLVAEAQEGQRPRRPAGAGLHRSRSAAQAQGAELQRHTEQVLQGGQGGWRTRKRSITSACTTSCWRCKPRPRPGTPSTR